MYNILIRYICYSLQFTKHFIIILIFYLFFILENIIHITLLPINNDQKLCRFDMFTEKINKEK